MEGGEGVRTEPPEAWAESSLPARDTQETFFPNKHPPGSLGTKVPTEAKRVLEPGAEGLHWKHPDSPGLQVWASTTRASELPLGEM